MVELQAGVVVERFGEHGELRRPVRPLIHHQVLRVLGADCVGEFAVQRNQLRPQLPVGLRKGLVEQVVAEQRGMAAVATGQPSPQLDAQLPGVTIREQFGQVGNGVVDVGAGLPTGGGVEVEEHPQTVLPAPLEAAVDKFVALRDILPAGGDEQPRVEGEPDVVETERGDGGHVVPGEEGGAEGAPEDGRILLADDLPDEVFDATR